MNRLISILVVFSIVFAVSGCAGQPDKTGSSSDAQRANAEKAQRELSSEVKK